MITEENETMRDENGGQGDMITEENEIISEENG